MSKIALLGDVVADVSLLQRKEDKIRLGGIMHSARGFWALESDYDIFYISPKYLDNDIISFSKAHDVSKVTKIGNVMGAPYVFLIKELKETGNQGYDFLLKDKIGVDLRGERLKELDCYDDILIISGNFNLNKVLENLSNSSRVHIDVSNNVKKLEDLGDFKYETIFVSTSSDVFKNYYKEFESFCELFKDRCNTLVLKENRGGSRVFDFVKEERLLIPSNTQPIEHSVGVGDVYDAVYVSKYRELGIEKALYYSSWIAAEYASTTFPDDFKLGVQRTVNIDVNDIIGLKGCVFPWEERKKHSIYIAAPDFDYVDTSKINELEESLKYHNFRPRRPVLEIGQLSFDSTRSEKFETYRKDIELLNECSLLIVVYLNEDPGTMIELGYAKAKGIPCFVYDPYNKAYNNMLTQLPELLSANLDEIISETFNTLSKK